MKAYARADKKGLVWSSPRARAMFLEKAHGKDVVLEIDDKPSSEIRRFFEGAVVPYVFYQNPEAGWETFRDTREAIKIEFLPSYSRDLHGKPLKSARSTAALSREKFKVFIEIVLRWMEQQGYEVPDSEDFNRWKNSAPAAGEVYPPLNRLIAEYKKHI